MISTLINTNSKGASFSIIFFNCVPLMIFLFTVLKKTPLGLGTFFVCAALTPTSQLLR